MTIMNFTKTILKNLFSKPATTKYPFVKKEYPEGTRGKVEIDIDSCIFCGICSRKCPPNVIEVNREKKEWKIDPFGCISCSACVYACPKKCLFMNQEYTAPAPQKTTNTFTKGE
jgi:ech hydrogenase subunit F